MGDLTGFLAVAIILYVLSECGWLLAVDGELRGRIRHVRGTPVSEMNAYERAKFGISRFAMDYEGHPVSGCSLEMETPDYDHGHHPHTMVRRGARHESDYDYDYDDEYCLSFRRLPRKWKISHHRTSLPGKPRDQSPPCKYQFYKVTPGRSTSGEDVCDYICSEDDDNCVGQYLDRETSMPLCNCGEKGNCSTFDSQATAMHGIVNGRIPRFLETMSRDMDQRSRHGQDYGKGDVSDADGYCSTYGEYMGEKCNAICRKAVDEDGEHFGGGYHVALPVTDNSCKDLPYYVLEACVCSCQYIIDERIQCLA